jgi:hypothetical protein
MVDRFDSPHTVSDLEYFFPVPSQTSSTEKLFLLGAMRLVRKTGAYNYLEIGSFRGGSLTPFLMDPACKMILSIDDRGRVQPDERGISYDYTRWTSQLMLDELHSNSISTDKLRTFDGCINELDDNYATSFELAFIDGEHTDEACFRDFLWTFPLLNSNSIIVFHDSGLIYKSLKIIMLYLDKAKVGYTFFKGANSAMSALIFGKYGSGDHIEYLGMKEDQSAFFAMSEACRIKQQFKNRARVRFAPIKILKLQIPFAVDIKAPKTENF